MRSTSPALPDLSARGAPANCVPKELLGGFGSALTYTGHNNVYVAAPDRGPFDGLTDVPYLRIKPKSGIFFLLKGSSSTHESLAALVPEEARVQQRRLNTLSVQISCDVQKMNAIHTSSRRKS
jgi:hypothetical protein